MALSDSWVKKEFSVADELEVQRQEALLEEMGLDRTEVDKLRSTMMSSKEAVAAKSEELERIRAHKGRKKDWEEFVDAKRRMGLVLHHSVFLKKLRNVIPGLILNDGRVRNTISMYLWRRSSMMDPETGLPNGKSGIVYLGWVSTLYIPEFEIDICNDAGVAIGQKRGWRTVLLRLITLKEKKICICKADGRKYACICPPARPASIITEQQALNEFGSPSGATSNIYRQQLHAFRNGY